MRTALRTAINENGLGLLIVADETLLNAAEASGTRPELLPGICAGDGTDDQPDEE